MFEREGGQAGSRAALPTSADDPGRPEQVLAPNLRSGRAVSLLELTFADLIAGLVDVVTEPAAVT
ncbi:hypothetical protein, partial [Luteimicrobium sp. DT211]|uniref:hypothetical protein n=1 Tax=Luteimicrobium sp. DT211 TaxID=3393412 RepID=UPI003CF27018